MPLSDNLKNLLAQLVRVFRQEMAHRQFTLALDPIADKVGLLFRRSTIKLFLQLMLLSGGMTRYPLTISRQGLFQLRRVRRDSYFFHDFPHALLLLGRKV